MRPRNFTFWQLTRLPLYHYRRLDFRAVGMPIREQSDNNPRKNSSTQHIVGPLGTINE